jgi:hypothetical protein
VVGTSAGTTSKVLVMFNKLMATSTSSPLLLESFVTFNWYAFYVISLPIAMNTLLQPNFPTMAARFNDQILQTLNPDLINFFSRIVTTPSPPI